MEQNNSLHRKGQVTVFMIIGIILLIIFAAILYITSTIRSQDLEADAGELALTTQLRPRITSFVESCLDEVATPGIYLLGIQGGIIYPDDPTKVLVTENALINYGYLNGVNQLSVDAMEKELDSYVEENLPACLNDFLVFAEQGITVTEQSGIKSDSRIGQDTVTVKVKYTLKASLGDESLEVRSFSRSIPLRVGKAVEDAEKIIGVSREESSALPSLTSFDAFISVFPFDESTTIYSLSDEQSVIDDAPFTFMFAVRDDETNTPPRLEHISDVVIREGEQLVLEFFAEDDEQDLLTFSSDSELFPVSGDGVLDVAAAQRGEYAVTVTVEDVAGLQDEQTFMITVVDDEE